jgi:hydrogenase-4 component B
VLAGGMVVFAALGWLAGRKARRHVTWGCGYAAPNPRMQYTGSSFSAQFALLFAAFLPQLRREQLSKKVFPPDRGHLSTHHVDAVERRMFEVIGQGEQFITKTSERIPEQPRFAFAAALVVLLAIVTILVGGVGR